MKTLTRTFLLTIVVALFAIFTGCGKGGSLHDVNFKKMNINGVKVLALAADESSSKNGGDITQAPLYSVSDDGTLVEIEYTIEAGGSGDAVDIVKANCRLAMEYVYRIGDDWLRLYNCKYECPGLEKESTAVQELIEEKILSHNAPDYLVRLSDGALFKWNHDAGAPQLGWEYFRQSDTYGVMEILNHEIISVTHDNHLVRLVDKGSTIDVTTMISDNIQVDYIATSDEEDVVGAELIYGIDGGWGSYGFYPDDASPYLIFPKTGSIRAVVPNDTEPSVSYFLDRIVGHNGKLYLARVTNNGTKFYRVTADTQNNMVVVSDPIYTIPMQFDVRNCDGPNPVFHNSEVMSWIDYSRVITFDPVNLTHTEKQLPYRYPDGLENYYDGVAYILDNYGDNHPTEYWICDLSADDAESHPINWGNALDPYNQMMVQSTMHGFWFSPGCMAFISSCALTDGRQLNFFIDVVGENAGQVRTAITGEQGAAGKVISTLVRLN